MAEGDRKLRDYTVKRIAELAEGDKPFYYQPLLYEGARRQLSLERVYWRLRIKVPVSRQYGRG